MPALWIALRLPRLPLEALSPPLAEPPEGFKRNPAAERAALVAIATVAYRFSGGVTTQATALAPRMHTVWLEAHSSLKLFKGLEPLLRQLRLALDELPYTARIGVGPTPECAALIADAERAPADSVAALRPLPAKLLEIPDEMLAALRGSGLRTVGEVLDLPIDELAMRFGQALPNYLGRLTGRLPDTRRFFRLPDRYRRRFEFDAELESLEALLFPLRRLLVELQQYLIARDTGVQEFVLELEHAEGQPTRVSVGMSAASRDAAHLQLLLRERLERTPMAGPVRALTLLADLFNTPRVLQRALFEDRTATDEEWDAVLDRLRIRLGVDAVTRLGLNDDYRPEKSWRPVPQDSSFRRTPESSDSESLDPGLRRGDERRRPLWLLAEPRPLAGIPQCLSGPERLESGWWDGLDATRDYYQAQTGDGARLWVFRDRRSGGWFLQGLWS